MKTLSLKFEALPGACMASGCDSDLGKRRLTMRRGTNSSGPGGLIHGALRMGLFVAVAAGLMLAPGVSQADAQSHGHGGHSGGGFGGGGHGSRNPGGWGARGGGSGFNHGHGGGGFGGFQSHGQENRHGGNYNRGNVRPEQGRPAGANSGRVQGGFNAGRQAPMQPRNDLRRGPEQQRNNMRSMPGIGPREGGLGNTRPGQEHLPQWWQAHRGLSPQQQADAMRREPGFRNLPQGQQQRLLNRLRSLDSRPPQVQQRMLNRVEMFERLSPERQQEVRGASQAFSHLPPQRKQMMIRAFQQLRQMPPAEREQMLHSGYGQQFTPQERTVLGNMLSIEPYQSQPSQPYFGRP
jgi:Protein of unknown function (DUF3106)